MSDRHLVIVTGGRTHAYPDFIRAKLNAVYVELGGFLLFHGACQDKETGEMTGADKHAHEWGESVHDVEVKPFPADWKRWRYRAGPIRNKEMVEEAVQTVPRELIRGLAFPEPISRGTGNCCTIMRSFGIEPQVWDYEDIRAWKSAL